MAELYKNKRRPANSKLVLLPIIVKIFICTGVTINTILSMVFKLVRFISFRNVFLLINNNGIKYTHI